jgi:ParB-like nuclease family protein
MQVCLLSPTCLIPTEEVDPDRVAELQAQILREGCWTVPITVEKDAALFVMDGHHRLAVAYRLQLPLAPVILLDYTSVRVESWRRARRSRLRAFSRWRAVAENFPARRRDMFLIKACPIAI